MIFSSDNFEQVMQAFLAYSQTLLPFAIQRELERQREEYEANISRILGSPGVTSRDKVVADVGEFVPDEKTATRYAKTDIDISIGNRVRGAIVNYKADNQEECARLLIFAQASMFDIIGMPNGSRALNEAAYFMFNEAEKLKCKSA